VIGGMVHRRSSTRPAPRILIVGGGFGGAYCAQALERLLPVGEAEIALLDRNKVARRCRRAVHTRKEESVCGVSGVGRRLVCHNAGNGAANSPRQWLGATEW
jgi:hypothetical protein